ncbi:MAG: hypothetical protein ABIH34_03010 [Nanoarchaeota archaeon]
MSNLQDIKHDILMSRQPGKVYLSIYRMGRAQELKIIGAGLAVFLADIPEEGIDFFDIDEFDMKRGWLEGELTEKGLVKEVGSRFYQRTRLVNEVDYTFQATPYEKQREIPIFEQLRDYEPELLLQVVR